MPNDLEQPASAVKREAAPSQHHLGINRFLWSQEPDILFPNAIGILILLLRLINGKSLAIEGEAKTQNRLEWIMHETRFDYWNCRRRR